MSVTPLDTGVRKAPVDIRSQRIRPLDLAGRVADLYLHAVASPICGTSDYHGGISRHHCTRSVFAYHTIQNPT